MYALFDTEIYNCIELRLSNEALSFMTIREVWENFPRDFTKLNFPRFAREVMLFCKIAREIYPKSPS